jgi:hypothetical protein
MAKPGHDVKADQLKSVNPRVLHKIINNVRQLPSSGVFLSGQPKKNMKNKRDGSPHPVDIAKAATINGWQVCP